MLRMGNRHRKRFVFPASGRRDRFRLGERRNLRAAALWMESGCEQIFADDITTAYMQGLKLLIHFCCRRRWSEDERALWRGHANVYDKKLGRSQSTDTRPWRRWALLPNEFV